MKPLTRFLAVLFLGVALAFPAAASVRFQLPAVSFLDSNGDPLSGALLYFYESGTTTALDTYSDEDLTTANANPVVADSAGRFGDIWLKSQSYKVVLKTSAGVTVTTMDPVNGALTVSGDDFKVAPQNPADMTVSVGVGTLFDLATKTRISKSAQTSGAITAPTTNPRYDIVYIDRQTGVIGVATGTEAASPSDPTIPDGKLPLARVSLTTSTTEITDSDITDIRELASMGWGDTNGGMTLVGTDAGASAAPVLSLYRNSVSPAANDSMGSLLFSGEDSAGSQTSYAQIYAQIVDPTDTTEDGGLHFRNIRAGTAADKMVLRGGLMLPDTTITGADTGTGTINVSGGYYINGTSITTMFASALSDISTLGTYTAASGTAVDFTGIPSGIRRITIMFDGVSLSGTSQILVQIGDSGGVEATGYTSRAIQAIASGVTAYNDSTGFIIGTAGNGAVIYGHMTLTLAKASTNTWISSHSVGGTFVGSLDYGSGTGGGSKSLSATLDRVRVTRTTTDTFDAGSITILYE